MAEGRNYAPTPATQVGIRGLGFQPAERAGELAQPRPENWTAAPIDEQTDDAADLLHALDLAPAVAYGNRQLPGGLDEGRLGCRPALHIRRRRIDRAIPREGPA